MKRFVVLQVAPLACRGKVLTGNVLNYVILVHDLQSDWVPCHRVRLALFRSAFLAGVLRSFEDFAAYTLPVLWVAFAVFWPNRHESFPLALPRISWLVVEYVFHLLL